MNKKLKIYSVLMAIVLVGSAITLTFNYESYSCDKRDGEVLTLDSLKEEFVSQIILKGKDLKDEQELTI